MQDFFFKFAFSHRGHRLCECAKWWYFVLCLLLFTWLCFLPEHQVCISYKALIFSKSLCVSEKNSGIILVHTFSNKSDTVSIHCVKGHEVCLSLQENLKRTWKSVDTEINSLYEKWSTKACRWGWEEAARVWGLGGIQIEVVGLCCQRLPVIPETSCFDCSLQWGESQAMGAFMPLGCRASWMRAKWCLWCVWQVTWFSWKPKKSSTYRG